MAMFKKEEENMATESTIATENMYTSTYDSSNEVAYITRGTKITGDISAEGHLVMDGAVDGNVNVDGNLILNGSSTGEIVAGALLIDCPMVNSNLTIRENVIVNEDTEVDGDIDCQNITIRGIVKGNITASGIVFLKSTATVEGGIRAASVGMEIGAKVKGKIDIR